MGSELVFTEWNPDGFLNKVCQNVMDGLEEWGWTVWLPHAQENCPVGVYPKSSGRLGGAMRASLTIERDDVALKVFFGGGGPAKDYIYVQETDASLNHTSGGYRFIRNAYEMGQAQILPIVARRAGSG